MKKVARILVVFVGLVLLCTPQVKATHTSGHEFYYVWKQGSTYEFTLIFYRHCTGFTASSPQATSVLVSSDSLNMSFAVALFRMPIIGANVPPLKPARAYNCYPDSSLCVEEYVYRGDITFPQPARDWVISQSICCRPNEIDNINPMTEIRAECGLNNLDFNDSIHQNISPIWHTRRPNVPGRLTDTLVNYPVWNVCEWQDYEIDQSVVEYQGDSVAYDLIQYVQDSFSLNLSGFNYSSPYSDTFMLPVDVSKPFLMDSITGMINYSPVTPPNAWTLGFNRMFQFAIKATEYRYDSFLVGQTMVWEARPMGYVIRNIQSITTDSSLCPKAINPFGDTIGNYPEMELKCTDSLIPLILPFNVLCETIDTNASCFLLVDTATWDTLSLKAAWMVECFRTGEGYRIMIEADSALNAGPYYLMFKQGDDSNTAMSSCGSEIIPYYDTVLISIDTTPVGHLLGDYLGNGNYNTRYDVDCWATEFDVNLSEKVLCSTVAKDGSDFLLVDLTQSPPTTIPIKSAVPLNCSLGSTKKIRVNLSYLVFPGAYTFYIQKGSDGNVFTNSCGDEWLSEPIPLKSELSSIELGPDRVFCMKANISVYLSAYNPEFVSYSWSTGETTSGILATGGGEYRVMAANRYGCQAYDTIQFIRVNCVGIDEIENEQFSIYPNPVMDRIYFDQSSSNKVDIEIYNALGKLVLAEDKFALDQSLNVSELQNGFYVVILDDGLKSQSIKFIKE